MLPAQFPITLDHQRHLRELMYISMCISIAAFIYYDKWWPRADIHTGNGKPPGWDLFLVPIQRSYFSIRRLSSAFITDVGARAVRPSHIQLLLSSVTAIVVNFHPNAHLLCGGHRHHHHHHHHHHHCHHHHQ